MNVYPSHRFGLALWRKWSASHPASLRDFHESGQRGKLDLPAQLLPSSSRMRACASTRDEIARALHGLPWDMSEFCGQGADAPSAPLEILVGKRPGTRSTARIRRHRCQLNLPRGAFLEIAPGVWLSSPELIFAQMAGSLEFGELLALGYELCGSYPVTRGDGVLVRRPLTTPERLVAFLGQLEDARPVKLARSAALQVRRKSASVMETEVAIVSLTSRRRGGLGLPEGQLNEPLRLSEKGRRIARQKRIVGDLCWWERRVVVEYDGRASHSEEGSRIRDSRRRDALQVEGVDVTTVTGAQFANVYEFSELMAAVSKKVGKRFRGWAPGQIERHMKLRREVRKFHNENVGGDF